MKIIRSLMLVSACMAAAPAFAMNFLSVEYVEKTDELVFVIAYRGTHDRHEYTVEWDTCRRLDDDRFQIFGKVIDSDPRDPARIDFTKEVRLSMSDFACRPSKLSLGTYYNLDRRVGHIRTIDIPAKKN